VVLPFASNRKIFNDPVYGFITIPSDLIFQIIEHQYFQRLRRIKQLGLTHLIYPGALHTRFHHSLGAMYLMNNAISVLRAKGTIITEQEAEAASIAILLHDIGHGPYSHTLEHSIVNGITHEKISEFFMEAINNEFKGKIDTALLIFRNQYYRSFLHHLISGQLDMDRLDYLKRDSFFTGVSEGVINAERIIKMLDVINDQIVVEAKGIYSIEKYIIARRLMYWQVYLHKTVIAAEYLLRKILIRAKFLAKNGIEVFSTPALSVFLHNEISLDDFTNNPELIKVFSKLDDFDIFTSIKVWASHSDRILSILSNNLVNRKLPKIEIQNNEFQPDYINDIIQKTSNLLKIEESLACYFVYNDTTSNYAYDPLEGSVNIHFKDNSILDIAEASDQLNISVLSNPVTKHFLCYPKLVYHSLKLKG